MRGKIEPLSALSEKEVLAPSDRARIVERREIGDVASPGVKELVIRDGSVGTRIRNESILALQFEGAIVAKRVEIVQKDRVLTSLQRRLGLDQPRLDAARQDRRRILRVVAQRAEKRASDEGAPVGTERI